MSGGDLDFQDDQGGRGRRWRQSGDSAELVDQVPGRRPQARKQPAKRHLETTPSLLPLTRQSATLATSPAQLGLS